MIVQRKYAAIDIGSNAIRLLISTITEQPGKAPIFKKTSLVRVPIRLGADVFIKGQISEENITRMVDALNAFRLLMRVHNIQQFRACGTSAMREAENGQQVVERLERETNLVVDIIDGSDEAAIIAATDLQNLIKNEKTYLYVDVGGGSTEFTLYANAKTIASKSFKLGSVRLLNESVPEEEWEQARIWVKESTRNLGKIDLIGSGGNINNIFKSSGKANGKPLSYLYLSTYFDLLQSLTFEERITELNLNADRADVIIPATRIFLSAMNWSGARRIFVPKIGLADGIIRSLYQEDIGVPTRN